MGQQHLPNSGRQVLASHLLPQANPWLKISQRSGCENLNQQDSRADGKLCFKGAPCLPPRAPAPVPRPCLGCPALAGNMWKGPVGPWPELAPVPSV